MDDCIITYLQEYANDLETRLQVGSDVNKLPVTLAVSTLLNPMFGLEPLIVGSGLMSSTQYNNARKSLLHMMQDYLDAKQPMKHWAKVIAVKTAEMATSLTPIMSTSQKQKRSWLHLRNSRG